MSMNKHEMCKQWMKEVIELNTYTEEPSEDDCKENIECATYILELLDKAESRKPEFEVNDGEYEVFNCNICNDIIPTYIYEPNFCPNCGQKLDWSDENECYL